jgi:protein phosphatase
VQWTGFGATDIGRMRQDNEDTLFVGDDIGLYVVCDGMGGHVSGATASQLAVETILASVEASSPGAPMPEPLLVTAIRRANDIVFQRSLTDPACRGMGTTVVAFLFEPDGLHLCHAGDSRAYRLRGGTLTRLTRDHSLENLYRDQPELEGHLGPATSNVIVRAVGLEPQINIEHTILRPVRGDRYLLCTDGLTDVITDEAIQKLMRSPQPIEMTATLLINAANDAGGIDNISVLLVGELDPDADERSAETPRSTTLRGV